MDTGLLSQERPEPLLAAPPSTLRSEGVALALTLFQTSNNVRRGLSDVDPTCGIKVDIYLSPPFGRDIDTPLRALLGPPKEDHEKL